MRKTYLLILSILLITLQSCKSTLPKRGIRYEYQLVYKTPTYNLKDSITSRIDDLPPGSRVSTFGPATNADYQPVDFHGYNIILYKPTWYKTRTFKGKRLASYKSMPSYALYVKNHPTTLPGSYNPDITVPYHRYYYGSYFYPVLWNNLGYRYYINGFGGVVRLPR